MVGKVVLKTGSTVREQVMLYQLVLQLVLLYKSDNWLVMMSMLKVL